MIGVQTDYKVKELLKSWSNTRRFTRTGVEYPSKAPFLKSEGYRGYLLSEDDATIVDKAVLDLKCYNEVLHAVLRSYYLDGLSCSKQSRATGRRVDYIGNLLSRAEIYIAAKTESLLR